MFGGGMILVWLVSIVGGYFLVKFLMQQNKSTSDANKAALLTILKRRYASGEINQQEFDEYKKNLLNA